MFPGSTLHGLNIEPDSISYIEWSETSNQPSERRGCSEVPRTIPGLTSDLSFCDLSNVFVWDFIVRLPPNPDRKPSLGLLPFQLPPFCCYVSIGIPDARS